jgi:predicted  nucleic acid-binding Zn-ribbon protein
VPGGIDAWIARATGTTARARDARDSASSPTVPKGRAIRDAEKEMSRLERRKATLTEKLLASSGHEELTRLGSELATTQRDLSAAEERWLTLSQ